MSERRKCLGMLGLSEGATEGKKKNIEKWKKNGECNVRNTGKEKKLIKQLIDKRSHYLGTSWCVMLWNTDLYSMENMTSYFLKCKRISSELLTVSDSRKHFLWLFMEFSQNCKVHSV